MEQIVGNKCMVSCAINGSLLQMLFNSGAQVTIVGRDWVEKESTHVKIQPLETLLTDSPLEVAAANSTYVPFYGLIDVTLEIVSVNHGTVAVQVPVLIGQSCVNCPLLGSNVIEEVITENDQTDDINLSSS